MSPTLHLLRRLLSKTPRVTALFWLVTVLAVAVGETVADSLPPGPVAVAGAVAAAAFALLIQFRAAHYVSAVYWLAVVVVSVAATVVTDHLHSHHALAAIGFAAALGLTLRAWHAAERTVAVDVVDTRRREGFYWTAVLCAFGLGHAGGDLVIHALGWGYGTAIAGFAVAFAVVASSRPGRRAFWICYVLAQPLGAALGDRLSKQPEDTGLGLGTVTPSVGLLAAIVAVVVYLSITRHDQHRVSFG